MSVTASAPSTVTPAQSVLTRGPIELGPDLVARARDGDEAAFGQLVRATYVETFTLAQRLMGNEADAADVVQETYLRAFRALENFRGDARFTTWLYRITVNCASTHLRRRERHRHAHLDDEIYAPDEELATNPEAHAEAWLWQEKLKKSLAVLPAKQRAVVVLHDVYDWNHDEISKELKITQTASKVRLHRGRKRLRELMYPERDNDTSESLAKSSDTGLENGAQHDERIVDTVVDIHAL